MLQNWDIYPGEAVFNRIAVWVDLARSDLMASYQTRVRTAVRKAVKNGLRVEWRTGPDSAEWFAEFYYSTMREIGAEPFYFFSQSYFRLLLEWKQARLAVCIKGDEPVAAAIFLAGPQVTEYHLSASSLEGKRLGGTNLLLHEAAQTAQSEGCRALYLGGGTEFQPDNPLLFFKAGFSAERAEFKIGKHVHFKEGYSSLREQFPQIYGAHPGRVLFYR
jgi:lipid II:glycine glycyltransferase (peptidoglycan interpeptide bridge formation enzyme)